MQNTRFEVSDTTLLTPFTSGKVTLTVGDTKSVVTGVTAALSGGTSNPVCFTTWTGDTNVNTSSIPAGSTIDLVITVTYEDGGTATFTVGPYTI